MKHIAACFHCLSSLRIPLALWLSLTVLAGCAAAPASPSSPDTQPADNADIRCCHNDGISDLATTELSSIQAQLDGMQEQINALRNQQHALTQVLSNRPRSVPLHRGNTITVNSNRSAVAVPRLEQARQLFQAGLYTQTVRLLKNADTGGNGSLEARHSMFLLMQSHWHLNNCESVINMGNRFASRFSGSPQAPEALYLVGQCQNRLQQKDIARTTWRKITTTYPKSPAARRAEKLLNGH